MSVKRYWSYAGGDASMQETETGNYVKYEDYASLERKNIELAVQLANSESNCRALAAECKTLSRFISGSCYVFDGDHDDDMPDEFVDASHYMPIVTPATDAFLAEVRAQGVERYAEQLKSEADRAEETGWEDAAKFLRSESEKVLAFAAQLRKGAAL